MRSKLRVMVGLVALGVFAFQLASKFGTGDRKTPDASASADSLQLGTLTLQACQIGDPEQPMLDAYCTWFEVPENRNGTHSDAKSRHIKLKVALIKSDTAAPVADLVTFLDGGPGGVATEDFPAIANVFAPLSKQHHILLVDQRGTGGSNALDCPKLTARSKDKPLAYLDRLAADKALMQAQLRDCLAEIAARADPQFYNTSDAMQDLEALRTALGNPQLNLVGVSYGTRVAQQYALRHPAAVRSMVLDSAVPNTLALGQEHARNLETALQAQFALCAAQPECAQRFGDSYQQLIKLRDRLRATPVTAQVPDPNNYINSERTLTAARLAGLVRLYAYNSATSALLPLMINEASKGNYAPLLGQEQLISDDVNNRITGGVGLSIGCSEDADLLTSNAADRDTLLGNSLIEFFHAACAVWPHRVRPADFHQPLTTSIPTLILAGEFDPVTPPRYAQQISQTLHNARVLLAPGQGHAVLGVRCMPQLLEEFVTKLQPASLDAACLDKLKPMPAFLDYNGAAP